MTGARTPRWKVLPSAAAGGGLGGALAAAHAWWLLRDDLRWHVIPAGALHGAALALVAALAAALLAHRPLAVRLLAAPVVGWIAGFASWPCLNLSLRFGWLANPAWMELFAPLFRFGLVGALAYLGWAVVAPHAARPGPALVATGAAAGILGCLWWWIAWRPGDWWWFAPLHGALWGGLAGAGVRAAERAEATSVPDLHP